MCLKWNILKYRNLFKAKALTFAIIHKLIVEVVQKYFPNLTLSQAEQFQKLEALYGAWNAKINVISRKDIASLYTHHVLHSLGIAKVQCFHSGARILDVGTGGGFPGIPLAIMFPEVDFYLVDSIGKKVHVVSEISKSLGLKNVSADHLRAAQVKGRFDFIVSRAVTNMPDFVKWVRGKVAKEQKHALDNGILALKGGDLSEELSVFAKASLFDLSEHFEEAFFQTKKVVHLPLKQRF